MTQRLAQTIFLGLLTLMAILAMLDIGQSLFAPVLAALVLGVVCAPLSDRLDRIGLPRTLSALLVLALLVGVTLTGFVLLEPTISRAIRNGPMIWRELTDFIDMFRTAVAGVERLQDTVSDALNDGAAAATDASEGPVAVPGVFDALALAPSFAAALLIFAGTFYFFLISREELYQRMDAVPFSLSKETLSRAEARVSRYFLTITIINAAFGVLMAVAMTLVGLPQPILWGLAAFLLNFVLYLGPASLALALLVAGIVSFDGAYSFLPVALYVGLNMTEAQFVTPAMVGRHMKLNPLLVFISLVFWLWLWGPVGGVVAIPIVVWSLYVLGQLDWEDQGPQRLGTRNRTPGV